VDTIAVMTSISLQYGVPLKALVDKFSHTRFEPSGYTPNPEIPYAKSVTDYVFRWLGLNFPTGDSASLEDDDLSDDLILDPPTVRPTGTERVVPIRGGSANEPRPTSTGQEDAPPCMNCGAIMVRAGACYACRSCGETGGCG
jgi:ribonucleoside-diphosphate reductase alpha chain